jgi:ParB/RepB/Spo0J family partition protein
MPETYDYRLIVGFRRFTACTRILRMEKIKATIVYGLTEEDAKVANFLENVARDNLNILEEARGLAGMFPENTPYSRIASSIKKHRDWVAIRFMLLKLSEPIQEAASNGLITQTDIRLIYSAPAQCRTNVFKRIISHKGTVKGFKTRTNPYKPPTSADIQERLRLLVNNGFGGILAKLLIWSGGLGITNDEIDSELQQMFIKYNKGNLEVKDFIGAYNISNSN